MKFVPRKLRHVAMLSALSVVLVACGGGGSAGGTAGVGAGGGSGIGGGSIDSPAPDGRYVVLTWEAPVTREDGSCLDDLAGYELSYGLSPGVYDKTIQVEADEMASSDTGRSTNCGSVHSYSYLVDNLDTGSWYFAVRAVDSAGNISDYSNEAVRTIQ